MALKELILIIIIAMILIAGCTTCKAARGTIVQKKVIGIVEEIEYENSFFNGESYIITLTDGARLHFKKQDNYPDYILVQDWKEVDGLMVGKEYQFVMEKDKSCNTGRPWTLVNVTEL